MRYKVLVLGASEKEYRFSNMAIRSLLAYGHEVVAIGSRTGEVSGVPIYDNWQEAYDIHTVCMYLSPVRQTDLIANLLDLTPTRIIFNPGTENLSFEKIATEKNIQIIRDCTLLMLDRDRF